MIKNTSALRGLPSVGTTVYQPGGDVPLQVMSVLRHKVVVQGPTGLAFNAYPGALRSIPSTK